MFTGNAISLQMLFSLRCHCVSVYIVFIYYNNEPVRNFPLSAVHVYILLINFSQFLFIEEIYKHSLSVIEHVHFPLYYQNNIIFNGMCIILCTMNASLSHAKNRLYLQTWETYIYIMSIN